MISRWVQYLAVLLLCLFLQCGAVSAGEAQKGAASSNESGENAQKEAAPEENVVESHHTIDMDGKKLSYTARTGHMVVREEDAEQKGKIFFVSYELDGQDKSERPVTFVFNGGPGAASVWLHLGALGPRRVALQPDGTAPPPPPSLEDNPETWLKFSDLVFVDPVGTGYSRGTPSDKKTEKNFYGVREDIESVGEFIRLFLTRYERWRSPKLLVGESYGGTRVAGLSKYLHEAFGIALNGLVLISPALDFKTIAFGSSGDLAYALYLPTYAATARRHGKLSPSQLEKPLDTLLKEVETFALGDYLVGLAQGGGLAESRKQALAKRLSAYTGLDESYLDLADLRVPASRFRKELMNEQKLIIGRMDSTITGVDPEPANPRSSYDPSLESLFGPFSGAVNAYLREELHFESDLPYEFLNDKVSRSWDWSSHLSGGQGYVDLSGALRDAMTMNKYLKVFIASGYYDLATPYFTVRYTVDHMGLERSLRSNVVMERYEAGHMMFTHAESLIRLTEDARRFYAEVLETGRSGGR